MPNITPRWNEAQFEGAEYSSKPQYNFYINGQRATQSQVASRVYDATSDRYDIADIFPHGWFASCETEEGRDFINEVTNYAVEIFPA